MRCRTSWAAATLSRSTLYCRASEPSDAQSCRLCRRGRALLFLSASSVCTAWLRVLPRQPLHQADQRFLNRQMTALCRGCVNGSLYRVMTHSCEAKRSLKLPLLNGNYDG